MRKFIYFMLGLMLFAGAGGLLVHRQLQLADDNGVSTAPTDDARPATRGAARDAAAKRLDIPGAPAKRRIDRGLEQYRKQGGGWNTFQAVLDVLNVVVGLVGIALAFSGVRMRRDADASSRRG